MPDSKDEFCRPTTRSFGMQDECAALPVLRAQYYSIIGGQVTSQVRDGDRWQSFHPGNAQALKREITRLELLCAQSRHPRAIRAGPPRRIFGPYGYASPYRY